MNAKAQLTKNHHDVSLKHQLTLRWSMEIWNSAVLGFVDERRASNVIPHLTRHHRECEEHGQQSPELFVLQELQVVALQVQETSDEGDQHDDSDRSRIVWWAENSDLNIGAFLHPLCDGFCWDADALNVHGVTVLSLSLGWEVHEHGRGVEAEHLENVRSLVEIDHREEEFVRICWRITIGVGQNSILVWCRPANYTLSRCLKSGEHHNDWIITRRCFHEFLEFVSIKAKNWLLGIPVEKLLHLIIEWCRALQGIIEFR